MNWITDKLTQAGGTLGAVVAYILNISLVHIAEIALYALVGSAIGEAVKEAVIFYKKKIKS